MATPVNVKEFRFEPESTTVTVVYDDDRSEDFTGEDNYKPAHHAAVKASEFEVATPELTLTRADGTSVVLNVAEGTPHETFDL